MHRQLLATEFIATQPDWFPVILQKNGAFVEVLPDMGLVRLGCTPAFALGLEIIALKLPPSLAGYRVYIDPTPAGVTA